MIQTMKGTRDLYPEDYLTVKKVLTIWEKVCNKYGFMQYDGPIVENTKLWEKKGEISEQMFIIKNRSEKSDEFTIRPEMTPTLARMIAQRPEIKKPIKLFSIPICMRYERPQKGRLREFYQLNVDSLFETENSNLESEILMLAIDILKESGLTQKDFSLRVSHRGFLNSFLEKYDQKSEILSLIDKFDKIGESNFTLSLKDLKLKDKEIEEILKLIKSDNIEDMKNIDNKSYLELKEIIENLPKEYKKYVEFDPKIIRGLGYYTGIIFEGFDKSKSLRAILGGGRYDNLVEAYGGQKVMGIGFGMGDVVFEELLKEKGLIENQYNIDYYMITMSNSKEEIDFSNIVALELRKKGKNVFVNYKSKGMSKEIKNSMNFNCKKMIIIGEEEVKKNFYTLKDLDNKSQEIIYL
ncbi:MAG: histidine--tRNA ligase [Candidatus Nanoarchaeia archaeon]|nr:histidine--tRNA ligase [Candidatus Nanoarchaeia archaeon]